MVNDVSVHAEFMFVKGKHSGMLISDLSIPDGNNEVEVEVRRPYFTWKWSARQSLESVDE